MLSPLTDKAVPAARAQSAPLRPCPTAASGRPRSESCVSVAIPTAATLYFTQPQQRQESECIVYKVECSWGCMRWRSDRRYSEFRNFHRAMTALACTARRCGFQQCSPLPPRMVTKSGNHNPHNITERRLQLQAYLRSLTGLCRRHRMALDAFLHAQPVSGLLDTLPGVTCRHVSLNLPPGMVAYGDMQLQFDSDCMCTVRPGSPQQPPGLELIIRSDGATDPAALRARAETYHRLLCRYVTPNSFPPGEEVRSALDSLRAAGQFPALPADAGARRGRGFAGNSAYFAAAPPRGGGGRARSHTQPPKGRGMDGRLRGAWAPEDDDDAQSLSSQFRHGSPGGAAGSVQSRAAAARTRAVARRGSEGDGDGGIRHTSSWQDMCTAHPPPNFFMSPSPQLGRGHLQRPSGAVEMRSSFGDRDDGSSRIQGGSVEG